MVPAIEVYKAVLAELKHYNTTSMTPSEFNYHIWIAELEYVKNRYWAYEQHQKQIDDLDIIRVVTDGVAGSPVPLINQAPLPYVAGQEWVQLPDDYMHLLAVSAQCIYKDVPCETDGELSGYISATPLKDDKRFTVEDDYYSKPLAVWPRLYYDQRDRKLVFKAGNSIVQSAQIVYLRYPTRIVFDIANPNVGTPSEFKWEQTLEIVKHCTISYLETIKDPRVQSMLAVDSRNFNQSPPPNALT